MTPKLQGALQALKMLQHDVETDAEEIVARVNDLQTRRQSAKAKTHGTLDKAHAGIGDIEEFVSALEGSNGAPNDLPGLPESSAAPSEPPAAAQEAAPKQAEPFPGHA